jgi:hypothetical protein
VAKRLFRRHDAVLDRLAVAPRALHTEAPQCRGAEAPARPAARSCERPPVGLAGVSMALASPMPNACHEFLSFCVFLII